MGASDLLAGGAKQCGTEFCSGSRFTNDKGARSTHVQDIIVAQFSCDDTWAKRSVSANIDASEENDESHTGHYESVPAQ